MRGIVSCSMLAALKDEGYLNCFDAIYGNSSGSVNGAYFLTADINGMLSIYYDDLASKSFVDVLRAVRGGHFFSVDFAFDEVFDLLKKLDYARVLASPIPLHVAVTLVDGKRTEVASEFADVADLRAALRAGAWLPLASRGTAIFRSQRAIDGGVMVSHPTRLATRDGFTHILSLSTKVLTGRNGRPDLLQKYVASHLNGLARGLGDNFLRSIALDAQDRADWYRQRTAPKVTPAVLDVGPVVGDLLPSRHDTNQGRLILAARWAYARMVSLIRGAAVYVIPRMDVLEVSAGQGAVGGGGGRDPTGAVDPH